MVRHAERGTVVIPVNPFPVARGRTETTSLFVLLPAEAFDDGEREIEITVSDQQGFSEEFEWKLLGPSEHGDRRRHRDREDDR